MIDNHLFILGNVITTPIGKAHPVYVSQYEEFNSYIADLVMDKSQLVALLQRIAEQSEGITPLIHIAQQADFFEFVKAFSTEEYKGTFLTELYEKQRELFQFVFKEDVIDKIKTSNEFEYYRDLITKMNDVTYKPPNPNPELARLDRLKAKLIEMKGESITFEAMYTSVLLSSQVPPNELTLYQFNKVFDRVAHFKNYDTSTLFKTIDQSGKVEIQPWYGTTVEQKEATITQDQLDSAKKLHKDGGLASEL